MIQFWRAITVEPVSFLYVLAIFAEYTALQELIFTSVCLNIHNNSTDDNSSFSTDVLHCNKHASMPDDLQRDITRIVSTKMKYYMIVMGICAVVGKLVSRLSNYAEIDYFKIFFVKATLFIGSWSDTLGRRIPMRIPSALGIVSQALFIAAAYKKSSLHFVEVIVYIAAIFNGLSGGVSNLVATCFGYISDLTDNSTRTKRIVLVESMFFIGGFCGYNLAGVLLTYIIPLKYEFIFILCLLIHISILFYIELGLKDTRTLESIQDTTEHTFSKLFSFSHVKRMFSTAFRRRDSLKTKIISELLACAIISTLATNIQTTLTYLFVKKPPLSWQSSTYSLYSGLNFLCSGMSLAFLLPVLVQKLPKFKDTFVGAIGFLSKSAGLILFGFATKPTLVFMCIPLFIFSEYTMPSIRSMLSKLVEHDERGKILAFVATIQNLITLVGGYVFYTLFDATVNWFPGISFVAVGITQALAVIILL